MIAMAGRKKINAQPRKPDRYVASPPKSTNKKPILFLSPLRFPQKDHVNPKYLLSITISHNILCTIPPTRNKKEWHQGKRRPSPQFFLPLPFNPRSRLLRPAFLAYLPNPQPKVDSTLQPSTNAIPAPPFSKTTPRARPLHLRLPPLPTSITTRTTTIITTRMHLLEYPLLPPSPVWGVLDLQHRIPGTLLNSLSLSRSLSLCYHGGKKGKANAGAGGGGGGGCKI